MAHPHTHAKVTPYQMACVTDYFDEAERLEHDTLATAPSWWKKDKKEQNAITDLTTKLPLKKVDLIEDPASMDSFGEPLRISRLATTTKKLEGISVLSREQKTT